MNIRTPVAEQIAVRALLRHYWRQGTDVPEAVAAICAVEGQEKVDEEMARHWFGQFQSGQMGLMDPEEEQGPSRKMVWLPSETWSDVMSFVSFKNLAENISPISARFRALAEPILDGLCPRVAKPMKICWKAKEELRRFERGVEIPFEEATNQELMSLEHLSDLNLLRWERTPVPGWPPPPNIVGFERLIIEGQLDHDLLAILAQISAKIDHCSLEFNDLDIFYGELTTKWIRIDDFFRAMPRLSKLVLYRHMHIPSEFLAHPSVLGCPSLEIYWLEFEAEHVVRWLKSPIGGQQENGQRRTRAKSLTIIGYDAEPADEDAEAINLLLGTLISEHRESIESTPLLGYQLELRDFEGLNLAEFEDHGLRLRRHGDTIWRLVKEGETYQQQEDENGRETLIEMGFFG